MYETKRNGENRTDLRDFLDEEGIMSSSSCIAMAKKGCTSGDMGPHRHQHGHVKMGAMLINWNGSPEPTFRFDHHRDDVTDTEDGADVLELMSRAIFSIWPPEYGVCAAVENQLWQLFADPVRGWLVLMIFFFCAATERKSLRPATCLMCC